MVQSLSTECLALASPVGTVRPKFCSSHCCFSPAPLQSFGELVHKPLLVDLTVEEGQRLKVIYGSCAGFHAVDVDSGSVYDIYLPTHVRKNPHSMVGWLASFCFDFSLCSAQCTNTGRGSSLPLCSGGEYFSDVPSSVALCSCLWSPPETRLALLSLTRDGRGQLLAGQDSHGVGLVRGM